MNGSIRNDIYLSLPIIVLSLGSLLLPMLEVFLKGRWSRGGVTIGVLLTALASAFIGDGGVTTAGGPRTIFYSVLYADQFSFFVSVVIMSGALISLLLCLNNVADEGIESRSEYYALFLMATVGAIIFSCAAELVTFFLGLEIMSMALYCMCGSAVGQRSSSEAALKYFLLGSFSSAFLLYGIALLYGLTGSTNIEVIGKAIAMVENPVLYFAVGLVLVGLVFKIGGVPFHFWAPDVYQGAPTSVTAYMACVIKASAVAAALRVMWSGFDALYDAWSGAVWLIAVLTMTAGNLIALRQRSVKRMLAYSSVAHAGYILVAFLAKDPQSGGGAAILFYLVAYTLMTMGAFGVILAMNSGKAAAEKSDDLSTFNGLGTSQPFLAFLMSIFMLSLAGIPPGLAGLLGKFYIFSAVIKADFVGIAIIGVINSAISCFYYLRVMVAMYFTEEGAVSQPAKPIGMPLKAALALCAVGVVFFGVLPWTVYDRAMTVMSVF